MQSTLKGKNWSKFFPVCVDSTAKGDNTIKVNLLALKSEFHPLFEKPNIYCLQVHSPFNFQRL